MFFVVQLTIWKNAIVNIEKHIKISIIHDSKIKPLKISHIYLDNNKTSAFVSYDIKNAIDPLCLLYNWQFEKMLL